MVLSNVLLRSMTLSLEQSVSGALMSGSRTEGVAWAPVKLLVAQDCCVPPELCFLAVHLGLLSEQYISKPKVFDE